MSKPGGPGIVGGCPARRANNPAIRRNSASSPVTVAMESPQSQDSRKRPVHQDADE